METTVAATSGLLSNGVWVGGIIFAVALTVATFFVARSEKLCNAYPLGTPEHTRGEGHFGIAAFITGLGLLVSGGAFLALENVQRHDVRDSIVATIEEENGLENLVRADDSKSHSIMGCAEGDEYVIEDYLWRDLSETSPTLVTGKIAKSAEEDGSCTYTVFPGETMP